MTIRHRRRAPRHGFIGIAGTGLAASVALLALAMIPSSTVRSQSRTVPCANPESQKLVLPPVLERSDAGNVLEGTLLLREQFLRLPPAQPGATDCFGDLLRYFTAIKADGSPLEPPPPAMPTNPQYADASPGPTLRARVGDLVKLGFINEVNGNRFDSNVDIGVCMEVGEKGTIYPGVGGAQFDKPPNCLHASSTANIHFHGTHTNPNSVGDNVFVQLRPLPRNNQGSLTTTPEQATALFKDFFNVCAEKLKDPLSRWPATWAEVRADVGQNGTRPAWVDKQAELLQAYEQQTGQPLWTRDQEEMSKNLWPPYYIGAYPYCFTMPAYTADVFPPPPGSKSPMMGQAPGTHWYHAHKHGSTAINVMNGMTGAFIVEGQYDDDLNATYKGYKLEGDREWDTRGQPVMILNQLGDYPNRLRARPGRTPTPAFSINGRASPIVQMQPGEVQLWRLINTSGRSAAYFMSPTGGLQWRQTAQDGVQLADENYQMTLNRPFYLAPGNRVDLLVKAPLVVQPTTFEIRVQDVMARANVQPTPAKPTADDPLPGSVLMTVNVAGNPVARHGKAAEMQFPKRVADMPVFLQDITDAEWARSNYRAQSLVFNSANRNAAAQHTINGIQFDNGQAHVDLQLGNVEEWTIKNTTGGTNPGPIDHPFHIHINPFQITEFFDPNENMTDPKTGQLLGVLVKQQDGKETTQPIPRYITAEKDRTDSRQCFLDPSKQSTWKPCGSSIPATKLVWWDVFAIPSGRKDANTGSQVIPGYFKMRSRFVDFPGQYVLHCHILIHEDRGMMFTVSVSAPKPVHHH
jgi:FtsP/CotA-like multicopper oxidase with cupredoxin domain